jgi:hypothetical protein
MIVLFSFVLEGTVSLLKLVYRTYKEMNRIADGPGDGRDDGFPANDLQTVHPK